MYPINEPTNMHMEVARTRGDVVDEVSYGPANCPTVICTYTTLAQTHSNQSSFSSFATQTSTPHLLFQLQSSVPHSQFLVSFTSPAFVRISIDFCDHVELR